MAIEIILPKDFEDDEWWIVESKGYLSGVLVNVDGVAVDVTVYDPARLAQDIGADLSEGHVPHWKRLLVVERVTPAAIRTAVESVPPKFFLEQS